LAQICGPQAKHIAVLPSWTQFHLEFEQSTSQRYEQACQNISLLLSGAGTREGFLGAHCTRVTQSMEKLKNALPAEVIGDVAMIPINKRGQPVTLPESLQHEIDEHVRPHVSYERLRQLAEEGKVVTVIGLSSSRQQMWHLYPRGNPDNPPPPAAEQAEQRRQDRAALRARLNEKAIVVAAALRGRLTSSCVMPESIARRVIRLLRKDRRGDKSTSGRLPT
jgi:hypothetical protein